MIVSTTNVSNSEISALSQVNKMNASEEIHQMFKANIIQNYPEISQETKQALLQAKTTQEIMEAMKPVIPLMKEKYKKNS